jgi:hypothetical protein
MATPQQATSVPKNAFIDEALQEEDVVVEIPEDEAAPNEAATDEPIVDDSAEVEARQNGWVDKDQWVENHGNEKGWKPADEFLDFRRNFLPILSKENREYRERIKKLEDALAKRDEQEAESRRNLERSTLQIQLRQAREENDWDKADEVANKLLDLKLTEKPKAAPSVPALDPEVQAGVMDFGKRNSWLQTDPRLAKVFARQLKVIVESDPNLAPIEALEDAKDMVKRLYPEKFPSGRRTAMAEGGGESGASGRTTRSWSQLKPEVRAEYDKFVEMNPEIKRENLLKRFGPEMFRS